MTVVIASFIGFSEAMAAEEDSTLVKTEISKKGYDWSKLINAIAYVESGHNPKAFNRNGNCAGLLQITPVCVKQCNILLQRAKSKKRYTMQDRFNPEKSKEMFVLIQEEYNPEHNIEKAIKCWNSGFNGNWKVRSIGYYKKVMMHYKEGQ